MAGEEFTIRQVSVFSENRPGRLCAISQALEKERVNILAFSIAEADGFGVVRALVDRLEEAYRVLTALGFNVAFTEVIAVKMRDEPGGLREIACMLGDAGINIEYAYAYSGKDAAVLILRVDRTADAVAAIQKVGGVLLTRSAFH